MTVARGMAMGVEGRGGPAAAGCGANGHMTVGRWGGERRGPAGGPVGARQGARRARPA